MNYHQTISPITVEHTVLLKEENRWLIALPAIYSILAFLWLKEQYPHPNFIPDSYSYLDAAFKNQSINLWPIGYSIFLRIFSTFTSSDIVFIFCQYLLLQASILYFLFTVRHIMAPGKWIFRALVMFSIANPITLYLSNFITSDSIFAALSLTWLSQLLWILHRPSIRLLTCHVFTVLFAFMVRYNAMYYPILSVAVIMLTQTSPRKKIITIGAIIVLVGGFIVGNMYKFKRLTGAAQFSAFGGWQLAANALYAYAHAEPDGLDKVPEQFRRLHQIVNRHMITMRKLAHRPDIELGTYYLWDENAPLKEYQREKYNGDSTTDWLIRWASVSPLYSAYGRWLITRHPKEFMTAYLWPNIQNYYEPGAEFLNIYNMGKDSVDELAKTWFELKTRNVTVIHKRIAIADWYSTIQGIINPLFFLSFIVFVFSQGYKRLKLSSAKAYLLIGLIWIANFSFSILASPIVLRYQVFPMVITLVFIGLILELIVRNMQVEKNVL